MTRALKLIVLLLFLISGLCGLIYEVVWTRMFVTIFGNTVFAVSTVLSAFMAGLGVGSFLLGRYADKRGDLLRLYGWLEILIGLTAALMPLFLNAVEITYVSIARHFEASFYVLSLVRFVLSFMILLPPTIIMGGTLPILSRYFIPNRNEIGLKVGLLYALNTFGAMFGCFATGFFLISQFGMKNTTRMAVVMNVCIGLMAWWLYKTLDLPSRQSRNQLKVQNKEDSTPAQEMYPAYIIKLSMFVLAVSGFTGLAYEVVFFRVLVLVIGSTVYAFSTMLTTFLFGIAFGSAVFAVFVDRIKYQVLGLGFVQIILGLTVLISVSLFSKLPAIFLDIVASWSPSWNHMVAAKFVVSFLLMLVPTLLLGGTFPMVSKIYSRSVKHVAADIGDIYLTNTFGAILGSFFAGFVLIPFWGIQKSVLAVLLLNITSGVVLLFLEHALRISAKVLSAAVVIIVVSWSILHVPSWDKGAMVSAAYLFPIQMKPIEKKGYIHSFKQKANSRNILYYKEGPGSTVSVIKAPSLEGNLNTISIQSNGKTLASNTYSEMRFLRTIGHLPMLLHPDPKEVLVVGLGAGVTAGTCTLYPTAKVDIVEIERGVMEGARYFYKENHSVVDNPDVKVIINDARHHLLVSDKKYDVITTDPIHPWVSGASSLYTREFYQLCYKALYENGVMCQWLPLNELKISDLSMIMKTFQSVFTHTSVWKTFGGVALIGSVDALNIDKDQLTIKMNDKKIMKELMEINLSDPYALASCLILGEREVRETTEKASLNTDDHLMLEYSAPRNMFLHGATRENLEWLVSHKIPFRATTTDSGNNEDSETLHGFLQNKLELYVQSKEEVIKGQILYQRGDLSGAVAHYKKAISINSDDRDAKKYLSETHILLGERHFSDGMINNALSSFEQGIQWNPQNPEAYYGLARVYERKSRITESIEYYKKALDLNPNYYFAQIGLGELYRKQNRILEAIQTFENIAAKNSYLSRVQANLGILYAKVGALSKAIQALEEAQKLETDNQSIKEGLRKAKEVYQF